jgi:hypothetical protein
MVALLIGVLLILFAVYAVLPFFWALNWWPDVVQFLKGGVPLVAVFVGLISFFVGVADIKDKIESKKEEEEEEEEEAAAADKAVQSKPAAPPKPAPAPAKSASPKPAAARAAKSPARTGAARKTTAKTSSRKK